MKFKAAFIETRPGCRHSVEEELYILFDKELPESEFWRKMAYLQNLAYQTHDDKLIIECERAKEERFGYPFPRALLNEVASDYNLPSQSMSILKVSNSTTFVDRVKDIVCQAAKKNNQTHTSFARKNIHTYLFYINADAFCRAIDEIENNDEDLLSTFLGGNLKNVRANVVCNFLGYVFKLNIINRPDLEISHILFAFSKHYNQSTVNSRLTEKIEWTEDQKVFLGTFEGLLRKYCRP